MNLFISYFPDFLENPKSPESQLLLQYKKAFELKEITAINNFLLIMPVSQDIWVNRNQYNSKIYSNGVFNLFDFESSQETQKNKKVPKGSIFGEFVFFTSNPEICKQKFLQLWNPGLPITSNKAGEMFYKNKKFFAFDSKQIFLNQAIWLILINFFELLQINLLPEDPDILTMGCSSQYGFLPIQNLTEYLNQIKEKVQNDPFFK